jgi:hypothetical protein
MTRWIWATTVAPLALLLGFVSPASGQSFPARDFDGILCVIELEGAGFGELPDQVEVVQGTFDSRKLCTGGASPNVRIECRKQIEDWPARNVNLRNVPCQINVSQCDVPGGLVNATSSTLTINRNGSARLQCHFRH